MELDRKVIQELSGREITGKCIWVNELERVFDNLEIDKTIKELVEKIIREYREISAISIAKALMVTREQNASLEDYIELQESYKELQNVVILRSLLDVDSTIPN